MPTFKAAVAGALLTIASQTHAALVGVVQDFPDITLNTNFIIYDRNGVDANTGLLRIVSRGSTLNHAPGTGNVVGTQSYSATGDTIPDSMFTVAINNQTGTLVSGSPFNRVTITEGNANNPANTFVFAWEGNVRQFGFLVTETSTGAFQIAFDGRFSLTADRYARLSGSPTTLQSQYFNDRFTQQARDAGAFRINLSTSGNQGGLPVGVSTLNDGVSLFLTDWVYGTSARTGTGTGSPNSAFFGQSGQLLGFVGGLDSGHAVLNGTVTANFWVPVPAAVWLLGSALGALTVIGRRRAD